MNKRYRLKGNEAITCRDERGVFLLHFVMRQ
jgi:hypothetical protein